MSEEHLDEEEEVEANVFASLPRLLSVSENKFFKIRRFRFRM